MGSLLDIDKMEYLSQAPIKVESPQNGLFQLIIISFFYLLV